MPKLTKTELLRELEGKLSDLQDETLSEIDYGTLYALKNTLDSIEVKLIKSNESKKQAKLTLPNENNFEIYNNAETNEIDELDEISENGDVIDLSAFEDNETAGNSEEQISETDLSQAIIHTHNNVLAIIETQNSLQDQLRRTNHRIQKVENYIDDVEITVDNFEKSDQKTVFPLNIFKYFDKSIFILIWAILIVALVVGFAMVSLYGFYTIINGLNYTYSQYLPYVTPQ